MAARDGGGRAPSGTAAETACTGLLLNPEYVARPWAPGAAPDLAAPGGQTPAALRWASGAATDQGMVRSVNQYACLDRPDLGLWAVADGMGGHTDGALASRTIVAALGRLAHPTHLGSAARAIRRDRTERETREERQAREDAWDAELLARNKSRLAALINPVAAGKGITTIKGETA